MDLVILGGAQTDFARNWTAEGLGVHDMLGEVVSAALEDARVPADDVGVAHVGNLAGELFCGQALLGGMVSSLRPEFAELPSSRHEAACASGSVAALAAAADLESGRYDVALVVGVELMRNVSGPDAAGLLGCAAWAGREEAEGSLPWPHLFARIGEAYAERHGLDHAHLARIAEINFENARSNPVAQARDWQFEEGAFTKDDTLNPVVDGMLRKNDCGRITDGASAILLATPSYAAARERTGSGLARLLGWGHRTGPLLLQDKLDRSVGQPYVFPHLRGAVRDAYRRAGVAGPFDLDAIELHDCFTITEYVALDHMGLTRPGESWQAIEDGTIERTGRLPINPSGGLIGLGHPVGATGVRMLLDAARQVTGRAEGVQVDGAQRVGTLNIGGSATTVVSFIVGRS